MEKFEAGSNICLVDFEENKYYTPDISEFYVGFEYEELEFIYTDKGWYTKKEQRWISKVYNATDYLEAYYLSERVKRKLFENSIRVKYLNREDIESLGFKYNKTQPGLNEDYFEYDISCLSVEQAEYYMDYDYDSKYCRIYFSLLDGDTTVFAGNIKNKSELVKLLNQLGTWN